MPSEELGQIFGRIRAGLRRSLSRGALMADPKMRELHDRLMSISPGKLTRQPLDQTRYVVIDTETTGLKAYAGDEICSISLLEMQGLELTGREYNSLVNPGRPISEESTGIHHIRDEDVKDAPVIEEILLDIAGFIGESVLIGHHVGFDIRFLNKTLQKELLCHLKHPWMDTMLLYLVSTGRVGHYTLEEVANYTRVEITGRHTSRGDAVTTAAVFQQLAPRLQEFSNPVQMLIDRQYELGHF
jgi:DNA polymerase-3 subunit epsilon